MTTAVDSPWMTADECAVYLRYPSTPALYLAVRRHGIPHRWAGGRMLFSRQRVDAWVQTCPPKKAPKSRKAA